MIPPRGFESQKFPLRHRLEYAFGLSAVTATTNTTIATLVRNYKSANAPTVVDTNPHHASFDTETGAICNPMSIIDKLNLMIQFNMPSETGTDILKAIKIEWTPIFFSFAEKLDAADDLSTLTVKAILGLLSDATEEDVTPLFNNAKCPVGGKSEKNQPLSTVNLTETVAIMNMDTDASQECVTFDNSVLKKARAYYTNKGALNACIGKTRHTVLTDRFRQRNFFIRKFVPRAIRRIMPYSYFGIMVHLPLESDIEQQYFFQDLTASTSHVGVKIIANYHEWHSDHNQDMSG